MASAWTRWRAARRREANRLRPLRQQGRSVPRGCRKPSGQDAFGGLRGGALPRRDRLEQIARELLDLVLDPSSLSLSRIALGASYRFPTLGHSIYGARITSYIPSLPTFLSKPRRTAISDRQQSNGRRRTVPCPREGRTSPSLPVRSKLPAAARQDRQADRRGDRLLHGPIWRAGGVDALNTNTRYLYPDEQA